MSWAWLWDRACGNKEKRLQCLHILELYHFFPWLLLVFILLSVHQWMLWASTSCLSFSQFVIETLLFTFPDFSAGKLGHVTMIWCISKGMAPRRKRNALHHPFLQEWGQVEGQGGECGWGQHSRAGDHWVWRSQNPGPGGMISVLVNYTQPLTWEGVIREMMPPTPRYPCPNYPDQW